MQKPTKGVLNRLPAISIDTAQLKQSFDRFDKQFQQLFAPKKRKLSTKEQLEVLSRIEGLISDTSLTQALQHLKAFSTGHVQMVYIDMLDALQDGTLGTKALTGWFDDYLVRGLQVAEERGALQEALSKTVDYLNAQTGNLGPTLKGLAYPTVILLVACGIAVGITINIRAVLEQSNINVENLSTPFVVVFGLADFVMYVLPLIVPIIGLIVFQLTKYIQRNFTSLRLTSLDSKPIFREYRLLLVTRFLNTFTLLVEQSAKEVEALRIIRGDQRNSYFAKHLMRMESRIQSGGRRSDAFNTGLFDMEGTSLLKTMGDSSHFVSGLKKVAEESQRRFLKNIAFYAMVYKVVAFAFGVAIALNVYGAITGLEELYTS